MNIKQINLKHMYRHTMDITREDSTVNADHSISLALKIVEENIPCQLSVKEIDRAEATDTVNPVSVVYKLFCPPDIKLLAGDRVIVNGSVYLAGEPVAYPCHKETLLSRKDLSCQADATTGN